MPYLRRLAALILLACAGLYGAFELKDPEHRALDDEARAEAPGSFVRLADGFTHYEAAGPDTAPVVVLAAGFSVPAYIWDSLYHRLGASGFRVIRYDYYGRGWSDRPDVAYDEGLFVGQLAGLLDSLRITRPVHLAGLSFGATVATSFVARHPERVASLIYVDPVFNAGRKLRPEERTPLAWAIHMVLRGGSDRMATGQLDDFLHAERFPDWVSRYRVQQQFEGTRESLRRTRAWIERAPHQRAVLQQLGREARPVLVVWGREDPVAPFPESQALLAAMPNARFVPVDSAAHLPHLERPDLVARAILAFLRESVKVPAAPPSSAPSAPSADPRPNEP